MYRFNYHKPDDMDAAQQMMVDAEDGVYLSGGMTLIPTLKARLASPTDVIDLSGLALSGIELADDSLTVGALTLHSEVAAGNEISSLSNLALAIGDAQVRNRGTIGGSIANSDPGADYPAAVVALGATINTILIADRNKAALRVFQKELVKGRKRIGIFYGAMHMPDFEQRLRLEYGLKQKSHRWITAWDLNTTQPIPGLLKLLNP